MTTHRLLRALAAQRGPTTGMLEDEDPALAAARRLAVDAEQVARARAEGFDGPETRRLTDRLWAYGVTALNSWMRDSSITRRVRAADEWRASFSLEGGRQRLFDVDTRIALAVQTVLEVLPEFVNIALRGKRWDPHHAERFDLDAVALPDDRDGPIEPAPPRRPATANLTTYFTRPLLQKFADVYQRWWNGEKDAPRRGEPPLAPRRGCTPLRNPRPSPTTQGPAETQELTEGHEV